MYTLHFTKMNGAGNDFVVLDNRAGELRLQPEIITRLCDRNRGVGADGVLLAEMPEGSSAELRMRYFNADGGEAEMCGNGARCFARFGAHLLAGGNGGSRQREQLSFETQAGVIHAQLEGESVRLAMSRPVDGLELGSIDAAGTRLPRAYFLNTGVPHVVVPVEDAAAVDVFAMGRALRYHERFSPRGANANFIEALGLREILLRTYERGVEGETLACGTGATASALVYAELTNVEGAGSIAVRVRSGDHLHIGFERTGPWAFENVTLGGPADFVFEGRISL
jgi:diaminopimelate epimerase